MNEETVVERLTDEELAELRDIQTETPMPQDAALHKVIDRLLATIDALQAQPDAEESPEPVR